MSGQIIRQHLISYKPHNVRDDDFLCRNNQFRRRSLDNHTTPHNMIHA